ncbi:MAG: carboxypeptidase-like regulatory domain-containing protein, partial [Planctomycetota bacterium]
RAAPRLARAAAWAAAAAGVALAGTLGFRALAGEGAAPAPGPVPPENRVAAVEAPEAPPGAVPPGGRVAVEPAPRAETVPALDPRAASVRGSVRDAATGAAVASFTVALLPERVDNSYFEPEVHEIEEPGGAFAVTTALSRPFTLFVHAPDHALWRAPARALAAGEAWEIVAELGPGGAVRGLLLDPASGAPIGGAAIVSERDAVASGIPFDLERYPIWLPGQIRSAPDGSFLLPHLSPGEHVLRVTAAGFAPCWSEPVRVAEGEEVHLPAIELHPGGALEGTVTAADGVPAANRRVIVSRLGVSSGGTFHFGMDLTDLQGHYRVDDLPPGMLLAILLLDETGARPPLVRPVACRAGTAARLDFHLAPAGARVEGTLRDAAGNPIPRENLALVPAGAERGEENFVATATDETGVFSFAGVAPGRYEILAILDSTGTRLLVVGEVEVADEPEVRRDLELGSGRIAGCVRAAADGRAVRACQVTLLCELPGEEPVFAGQVPTDGEGRYAFPAVPWGAYLVHASPLVPDLGFQTSEEILLDARTPAGGHDFALPAGGSARITVRDGTGRPLAGVGLTFRQGDGTPCGPDGFPTTGAEGEFVLLGLRPGPYHARAAREGFAPAEVAFACRIGLETAVEIVLRKEEQEE